ncbi:hypothetical protein HRW23_18790 [Streptomyces lunaelactis]|uniref:DUF6415 family natural product biosynthesis protein n=1 Tax=Streptomyces lunaelactis TaxID=1535768 RepID=UPI001584A5F9|nr:DUF6415 family natural product biosynthesis protein [Streptomyces lunaelactis]NUK70614.1 hypothetical protein [Streptomyces lunaelactis]NUK79408.1 hypothetical protein [Streptomyces lunaelactis]
MKAQHVRHWEQDDDVVERVLSGLRLSLILDRLYLDTFYRDLTAVLHENAAPTAEEIEKLADRLRGALMPLVAIVLEHHDQPGKAALVSVLVVSGGRVMPASLAVVNESGSPVANYAAGPASAVTANVHRVGRDVLDRRTVG